MAYSEDGQPPMHSMFDNIYVPRDAYRAFLATGTWPDGTVLLMEIRGAGSKASINKRGKFQTTEVMGFEAHVKDAASFEGGWAFFGLNEIGRASCRERVCQSGWISGVAVTIKKKKK